MIYTQSIFHPTLRQAEISFGLKRDFAPPSFHIRDFIHHFLRSFFGSFGQTVITTFRSYFFPSFPISFTHSLTHSLIYSFLLSSTTAKRQYLRGITQSFFDAHYQVFHSCAAVLNSFTFQNGLSQAVRQSFSRHTDFTQTKTSTFNLL